MHIIFDVAFKVASVTQKNKFQHHIVPVYYIVKLFFVMILSLFDAHRGSVLCAYIVLRSKNGPSSPGIRDVHLERSKPW